MEKKRFVRMVIILFSMLAILSAGIGAWLQKKQVAVVSIKRAASKTDNNKEKVVSPLPKPEQRITKKAFGTYVEPGKSPVNPERFRGFHTGADFEIFSEEENVPVEVKALCSGEILSASQASGYGGFLVTSCKLNDEEVTVIYGHLLQSSLAGKTGDKIKAGDYIGKLGEGYSRATDGERKHLHLGIHKGTNINILGYVPEQAQLVDWIDPDKYLNYMGER